jgi:hypothetical protein
VAENLTRQILHEHLADGQLEPGTPTGLCVDQEAARSSGGRLKDIEQPALQGELRPEPGM